MIRPDPNLFTWQTFNPERRADLEAGALQERCDRITTRAAELGAKPEARPIAADMVAELIARHVRTTRTYWAAESRCASSMITGPANFPVERNRKRLAAADKRGREVQEHLRAALRRLERFAFPHGMGDAIRSADPQAVAKLRAKLKAHGFRWAPSEGAWQRHLNNAGRYAVKGVLGEMTAPAPQTTAERYGIAITARFTDDDAANAYMATHPGEGVLEVVAGEIQIARCDDHGSARL